MHTYIQGDQFHDTVLLGWFFKAMEEPTVFQDTFGPNMNTVSQFFQHFRAPRILWYDLDDNGNVLHAAWGEKYLTEGVHLSWWTHPDHRGKPCVYRTFCQVVDTIFKYTHVIVASIGQKHDPDEHAKYIKMHERLGYVYLGKIPGVFFGRDFHIMYLTQENWHGRRKERR